MVSSRGWLLFGDLAYFTVGFRSSKISCNGQHTL